MSKIRKKTLANLIKENKEELLADQEAMEVLEKRVESKFIARAKSAE
ncbi:hypothetical protein BTO30_13885 [Domibacillus antri]|uniref:Fur-regulated basic protein B n=1 Tax=Domibacillus antri TaxID=1714264 RepID=A0A1Q8Q2J9_9BACI|nr:FbpB family small basic protein [Domibacillus antri]OLN21573.1 hypothetical protein BTO30_13885 [Domibacillus antri]